MRVTDLQLPDRIITILKHHGIVTVEYLIDFTRGDLQRFRGIGDKALDMIESELLRYNCYLDGSAPKRLTKDPYP